MIINNDETPQDEHSVEDWHGFTLADNYAWLESPDSPGTVAWVEEQNEATRHALVNHPGRPAIAARLEKWASLEQRGTPIPKGKKLYQWQRKPNEQHFALYDVSTADAHVVLNPNEWSTDGSLGLDWSYISPTGKYIAYGVIEGGNRQNCELVVTNLSSGEVLSERIPNTNYASVAWLADDSGFYYTRYDDDTSETTQKPADVFFHALGTNLEDDKLVFSPKNGAGSFLDISLSTDNHWLVVTENKGWSSTNIYVAKNEGNPNTPAFTPLVEHTQNHFKVIAHEGYFYIRTDTAASNYKVMRVPVNSSDFANQLAWEEVVPESTGVLKQFFLLGGKAVLVYQENASSQLVLMDLATRQRTQHPLPALGTLTAVYADELSQAVYYCFESYAYPRTTHMLILETGEDIIIDRLEPSHDLSDILTEQVTCLSQDGTPVTMFIVRHKNTQLTGDAKTLMYGYGGFNIGTKPYFLGHVVDWVKSGGVYVATNIRGGDEYGEAWHRAGMLENKQNVVDDFIAVAEWLIKNNYTQPKRLAIWGSSNGGLLVGAAMVQRPELFGGVVCHAPLLDMLKYPRWKMGAAWIGELGDPQNPKHFDFLFKLSPYHNIVDGTHYPAVFLSAGANDSEVDPAHARKMAAALQQAAVVPSSVYYREYPGEGHISTQSKTQLAYMVDMYTFLQLALGQ